MADVNANIHIDIDSSGAVANLKKLQSEITAFNRSLASANTSAAAQAASLNRALMDGINATGAFQAKMVPVTSSVERFSNSLDKGKLSLGEYTRYAASQIPGMSKMFRREHDMMERVATDRVKKIQTQYIALGKTAKGVQEALAITPNNLARGMATDMAVATQKAQIFNKIIDDGSTKLLNWGKNTQWAGRQLMVGFSLPLAALGTVAAKTFMELDKSATAFKRVYGDLSTTTAEVNKNLDAMRALGQEYTKYGIAVNDTLALSARVAATGQTNQELMASTEQTLRFATLGQMDYNQALDATISLQSAFGVSSEDLANKVNYLNAVENQTVLTIEDMAAAIPRVATVVKGLGGDVEDLAVMMTAMREGGVSAENAANALKSGLASLINPTNRAQESMAKLGINMNEIINANRGDLLGTVQAFGKALSMVSEFERQQALEQIFGKYQYARMGALFDNIANSASQASRAMDLAGMSAAELGQIADRELGQIQESTTVKFMAALEQLKIAIAPLGEAFLKGVMPIMEALTKIAEAFTNLPDPIKNVIAAVTGIVAGLGPVFLMTFGLIGNGLANLIKGFQWFRKRLAGIKGDTSAFEYLATAELEAMAASQALEGSVTSLTGNLLVQRNAVAALTREYERYASAAGIAGGVRGPRLRMATGGIVPGVGNTDKVPALLTPGESVINKKSTQKYGPLLSAINSDSVPGFATGQININGRQIDFEHRGTQNMTKMIEQIQRMIDQDELDSEVIKKLEQELITNIEHQTVSIDKLANTVRDVVDNAPITTRSARKDRSSGASRTPEGRRALAVAASGPSLDPVKEAVRASVSGMGLSSRQIENLVREQIAHIVPTKLPDGTKDYGDLNNLQKEVGATNNYMNRVNAALKKIESGANGVMTSFELLEKLSKETGLDMAVVESEVEKLKAGIAPADDASRSIARAFAKLDAEATAVIGDMSALGTNVEKAYMATAYLAADAEMARSGLYATTNLGTIARSTGAPDTAGYGRSAGLIAANAMNDSVEDVLGIRSPAEAAAQAVDQYGAGMVVGAQRAIPEAKQAGKLLANATISEYRAQLAKVQGQETEAARMRNLGFSDSVALTKTLVGQDEELLALEKRMRDNKATETQIIDQINVVQRQRLAAQEQELKAQILAAELAEKSALTTEQTMLATRQEVVFQTEELAAEEIQVAEAGMSAQLTQGTAAATGAEVMGQSGRGAGGLKGMFGGLGGKMGLAGMALGMGSMIPFMAQGEDGNFMGMNANTLGMGMMGAGMALDFGSIASSMGLFGGALGAAIAPIGALAAVAGAGAIAFKIWRDNVDGAAQAAADMAANTGMASNAMNNMFSILGKGTPAQNAAKLQLGITSEEQNQQIAQYQGMLESESGQAFMTDLQSRSTGTAQSDFLADYIKSGVAGGGMTKDEAKAFADAVGIQTGNATMAQAAKASLESSGITGGASDTLGLANSRQAAVESSLSGSFEELRAAQAANADAVQKLASIDTAGISRTAGPYAGGALVRARYDAVDKRISNEDAAAVTGSSVQLIQDYGNAIAQANAELASGKITFEEYSAIANESKAKTSEYTMALQDAIIASSDMGATTGALAQQLQKAGLSEEDAGILTNLKSPDQMASGTSAVLQGVMTAADVKSTSEYMAANKNSDAARVYQQLMAQGNSANAMGMAGLAQTISQGGYAGLDNAANQKQAVNIGMNFVEEGGSVAEFQQFLQSIPPEVTTKVLMNFKTTGGSLEDMQQFIADQKKLASSVGGVNAGNIQSSKQYQTAMRSGDTGKITDAADKLKKVFGDDQESIDKYINLALKTEPDGLVNMLPNIATDLEKLNEIPPDIRKMMGIDLANPDQVEDMAKYTDDIKLLGEIINGLPEDRKELGASIAFDENGKPKTAKQFLADYKKIDAQMSKLKSKNTAVRKKAMMEIITMVNGEEANEATFDKAQKTLEDKFGPQVIANLPPDIYRKAMAAEYDATQLREQADALDESAATMSKIPGFEAMVSQMKEQASALRSSADALESAAFSDVAGASGNAAAASNSGSGSSGGGGGGGGEKPNPFKDFKKEIVNQIKLFSDMEANLKNLMSKKMDFFALMNRNKGLDDKIRKARLNPILGQQLMGMDPKDANKILGKMTGKNGKLTKEGRRLQDRYMVGNIQSTMTEADTQMLGTRMRARATESLYSERVGNRGLRGASTAMTIIGGDEKKASEYVYLLNKANKAWKAFQKDSDNPKLKNKWNVASKALQDYIDKQNQAAVVQNRLETGTESANNNNKAIGLGFARRMGANSDMMEKIAGNESWSTQAADISRLFENPKTIEEGKAKWKKLMEEVSASAYAEINLMINTDPIGYALDQVGEEMSYWQTQIELKTKELTAQSDAAFAGSYGKTKDAAQNLIDANQILIDQYQSQIDIINDKISGIQHEIDLLDRGKRVYQDQIDAIQDIIDGHQRAIDTLQHEMDLRNHQADLLNHELDLMQKQEDAINEAYDKRIEALTKTTEISQHLLDIQQKQLGISQALSTGDVYAAAAAANEYQQTQMGFAQNQAMQNLEDGRQNALEGVRSSSGMSRVQIEEALWQIGQQNYQTEQQIWEINQLIYAKNQEMLPLKEAIEAIDDQIRAKNDEIWVLSQQIYDIQQNSIKPLSDQNKLWSDRLKTSATQLKIAIDEATVNEESQLRSLELIEARLKAMKAEEQRVSRIARGWKAVVNMIAEANARLNDKTNANKVGDIDSLGEDAVYNEDGTLNREKTMAKLMEKHSATIAEALANAPSNTTGYYKGGRVRYAAAGFVSGDGSRDSVAAALTPGEFVIRKSMVDKYGMGMLSDINTGSFALPRFNMPATKTRTVQRQAPSNSSSVNAPVYNSYTVNVPMTGSNVSADEVAMKVMSKIKSIESSSIRRVNGY